MLRSQTVNTIQDLSAQGKSVQEIAQELKISRTTVRKYVKHPEAVISKPRPPRPSKRLCCKNSEENAENVKSHLPVQLR
jgi:transposase